MKGGSGKGKGRSEKSKVESAKEKGERRKAKGKSRKWKGESGKSKVRFVVKRLQVLDPGFCRDDVGCPDDVGCRDDSENVGDGEGAGRFPGYALASMRCQPSERSCSEEMLKPAALNRDLISSAVR